MVVPFLIVPSGWVKRLPWLEFVAVRCSTDGTDHPDNDGGFAQAKATADLFAALPIFIGFDPFVFAMSSE